MVGTISCLQQTNILKTHENFVMETIAIPINGVTLVEMNAQAENSSETIGKLISKIEGVVSLEQIRNNDFGGKWLLLTKKSHEQSVVKKLSEYIDVLYKTQKGQKRIITIGRQTIMSGAFRQTSVGTYAEALMKKYNPKNIRQTNATPHDENKNTVQMTNKTTTAEIRSQERDRKIVSSNTTSIDHKNHTIEDAINMLTKKLQRLEEAQHKGREETTYKANMATTNSKQEEMKKEVEKHTDKVVEKVMQMVDKKLQDIQKEQAEKQKQTEKTLSHTMEKTIEKRLEAISGTVATQVTKQLMEVFQHYTIPNQQRTQTWSKQKTPTRITQDSTPDWRSRDVAWETRLTNVDNVEYSPIEESKKEEHERFFEKGSFGRIEFRDKDKKTNTTNEILQALNEIETGSTNKHQNHDKILRCEEIRYK